MAPVSIVALLNAVPMPLLLIGRDERIIAANALAELQFGRGLEERHYISALRQPVLLDCVETALADQAEDEVLFPTRDGDRDVTYRATAAPVTGGEGVLLSLEDITHVQEAGQMRRDFVANVSHELRTPLTALMGFIETLRGPARDDPKAQARFLKIMAGEAERMSRLIQDLLSLSSVESEERMRPTDQIDLAALVRSSVVMLGPMADDANVTIGTTGADVPVDVVGDADQLQQILSNLLENAIKYGGNAVQIAVSQHDHDPTLRGPAIRIEVHDDGPGIDPLHLPRLTEQFYRIDDHRGQELGGTGLGLAIVKHIVNRHRGRLRIESSPGQGSRFAVVLPG